MFWVVWGLPAVVVIAGFLTLGIAIRAGGADASIDAVQRMAQVQQTDLSADRAAEQQGLGASLALRDGRIVLQMLGSVGETRLLNLQFEHPTASSKDRVIALTRDTSADEPQERRTPERPVVHEQVVPRGRVQVR